MAKKFVSTLEGHELDYWVAMAMEEIFYIEADGSVIVIDQEEIDPETNQHYEFKFDPSSDWAFSGPIIEESGITFMHDGGGEWYAVDSIVKKSGGQPSLTMSSASPLVAAIRMFVAIKFGFFVDKETLFH